MLNSIHSEYWIPKRIAAVRKIIREGILCGKNERKGYSHPIAGPFPQERVTLDYGFSYVGVNYICSVFVKSIFNKEKNAMYKSWIVLFTFSNSYGIYLDFIPVCTS